MPHFRKNDMLEGHYRVEEFLDQGGMAEVYIVIDTRLDVRLALKIIKSDIVITPIKKRMFRSEAKRHAQLLHEGIPQIKEFFIHEKQFCIVMEYVEGIDFRRLLETAAKPFKVETVLDWADQILDTLEYIHGANVVHRDIKPSNFKITPRNRIKLLDFGISHGTIGEMTDVDTRTIVGASPPYAAIEQGVKTKDWKTTLSAISDKHRQKVEELVELKTHLSQDIFSLGATLYHLLTKRFPDQANLRAIAVWADRPDTLVPLRELNPDVPPEVAEVIMNALALEREQRPASAAKMRELLREARREIEQRAERQIFAERLANEIDKLNQSWSEQIAELRQASEEKLAQTRQKLGETEEKLGKIQHEWAIDVLEREQLYVKQFSDIENRLVAAQKKLDNLTVERSVRINELQHSLEKKSEQAKIDLKKKQKEINDINNNWLEQVAELRQKSETESSKTQKYIEHLESELEKQAGAIGKLRREVEAEKQETEKAREELKQSKTLVFDNAKKAEKALQDLEGARVNIGSLKRQLAVQSEKFKNGLFASVVGMVLVSGAIAFIGYNNYIKPKETSSYSANAPAKTPFSSATPIKTPTAAPTAPPIPTPVPVYDIPEIKGNAGILSLSEGGETGKDTSYNIFSTEFVESKTRYVFFRIDFNHDSFISPPKIKLTHRWFKNGKLLNSYNNDLKIIPFSSSTEYAWGYGWKTPGTLKAGDYELDIVYKGKVIASKKFIVVKK